MKYSLYNEAQWFMEEEFREHSWAENGPMVDAMGEPTLEDALYHIISCCSAVLDGGDSESWPEWLEPEGKAFDSNTDIALLKAFDQYMEYGDHINHPWRKEIKELLFLAELGLETA